MEDDKMLHERMQKQLYLKQNIADMGYDKVEFANYINYVKPDGSNIDTWSLEELKDMVRDFKTSSHVTPEKSQPDSDDAYHNESPPIDYQIKENNDIHNVQHDDGFIDDFERIGMSPSEKENSKEDYAKNSSSKDNKNQSLSSKKPILLDFEDTIKISDKTAINKADDVFIEITEVVNNPGGLFSFSYLDYIIDTHPFGWNVARREQDFKRLRDYLLKKFPQFVIPPFLQNKLLEAKAEVETKKLYYQEFLREVVANSELAACKYLEEFLSINDYEGFREVRRMREKEPTPNSLSTYSNIKGRAQLTIQCQNPKILNNYDTFFIDRYEQEMKNLKEAVNAVKANALTLASSIKLFGHSINNISELFSDGGFEENIGLYNDIQGVSQTYEESVLFQAEGIQKQLDVTINFHLLEANSFREFNKNKEEVYWDFYKIGKDLQSKKDRLWEDREKQDSYAKWNLHPEDFKELSSLLENEFEAKARMLPKETHLSWDKNNQYKHLQRRSVEEIGRCSDILSAKIRQKFIDIAKEQLHIINR